jgi:hypothetical protein
MTRHPRRRADAPIRIGRAQRERIVEARHRASLIVPAEHIRKTEQRAQLHFDLAELRSLVVQRTIRCDRLRIMSGGKERRARFDKLDAPKRTQVRR